VTEEDEVNVTYGLTFTVETTLTTYTEEGFKEYAESLNLSVLDDTDTNEESKDHTPSRYILTVQT
jgi:hypothetical protein